MDWSKEIEALDEKPRKRMAIILAFTHVTTLITNIELQIFEEEKWAL